MKKKNHQYAISLGHTEVKSQVFTAFYCCTKALSILLPLKIPPWEYSVSFCFHFHHKHRQFTSLSTSLFRLFIELTCMNVCLYKQTDSKFSSSTTNLYNMPTLREAKVKIFKIPFSRSRRHFEEAKKTILNIGKN